MIGDRSLLDAVRDAIFLTDTETGMILDANSAAEALCGRGLAQLRSLHHSQLHPPEAAEQSRKVFDQQTRFPGITEGYVLHRDGHRIPVEISASHFTTSDGRQVLVGVFRDTTERNEARAALRRSEERFRQVAESAGELIWEVDAGGLYVYANPVVERLLGYRPEELVGRMHFYDLFVPPTREENKAERLGAFGRKEPFRGLLTWNVRKDGSILALETSGAPVVDASGSLLGYRGADTDVTARKQAEEALKTSEEKYRTLVETTGTGYLIIDKEGKVIDANREYVRLSGHRELGEILGRSVVEWTATAAKQRNAEAVARCARNGFVRDFVVEYVDGNNHITPIEVNATVIGSGESLRIIALCRDITERNRVEKDLREKEHLLSQSQRIAQIGSWSFDLTSQAVVWSEETYAVYGVSPGMFTPSVESLLGLIHPADRRAMEEWIGAKAAGRSAGCLEFRAVRPDGSIRTLSGQGELVFSSDTHTALMVGTVQDITERKRAEEVLKETALVNKLELGVQEALAAQASLPAALEECCGLLIRALDGAFGRIWTLNSDGSMLELQASAGLYTHIDGGHRHIPVGLYKIGRIAAEKQPLLTNNVIGDPSIHDQDWAKQEGMVAFAGYPLLVEDRVVGVMAMFSRNPLPDVALRALARVANRIAATIERARTNVLLQESEERFRATFEQAAVGIAHVSPEGRFLRVNQRFCEIAGYSRTEILGFRVQDITHPDDLSLDIEQVNQLLTGQCDTYSMEKRYIRKSGEVVWINLTVALVRDPAGQPLWFIRVIEDIDSRKQAEEKVRQLSHAMEHSPALVVMTDLHGTITYVNHKFCEVTGYSLEESIGQNPRFLKSGEHSPEMYQELWARITMGEVWRGEFHNRKKNGELYWEGVAISPVLNSAGQITHFVAVGADITDRKQADEERENLHAQLAQAQKMESVGRLAGGIAHDFSNLMSIILLQDDSALQELSSEDPLVEPLTEIRKAAERAVAMTQQLMTFSRKQALQTEVLNLNSVLAECEKLVRPLIGEDIRLMFIPGPELGLVRADSGQLGQVVMNLVVNSRDAMPHGGTLTIETASVEVDEPDARTNPDAKPSFYVTVSFRDTGVGMDKKTQERVFEPFFTTKEVGKGTGLGLSMVYGIVKQSGGFVTVHSEPGHGSEFKIYLPRILEAPESAPAGDATPGQLGVETILVVEDEPALREPVCRLLEGAGYCVLVGKNVDEAIQIVAQHSGPLDLLLTDVVMPGLSGPQLAQQLLPLYPQMKVLYMSGYPEPRQLGSALTPEMDFIQKPFTRQKLLGRLREVLKGRKLSI
jgi:PAS domain S-box-containing protein